MTSPNGIVNVVVTCSNRKRLPAPPALSARTLPDASVAERAREWIPRLERSDAALTEAVDLYAGEHWSVVRALPSAVTDERIPVQVWILSAGYGLITVRAKVRSYAATFSAGHADAVAANGTRRQWWHELTGWAGPEPELPRSLEQLAARDPRATVVMAASPPYLDACSDDLSAAARALHQPSQLSVICTGASPRAMRKHLLPGDARLQHVLGGTRQSLNVRVLAYLLAYHRGPLTHDAASSTLNRLLANQPALAQHDRKPCSDDEVADFIRTRLIADPSLSHSRLLREFRDAGNACEQARFAGLFREVRPAS